MGFKTALLVYTSGLPAGLLRLSSPPDPARTSALVAATHPGWAGTSGTAGRSLADDIHPPEGSVYAGSFPGIELLCDREVMVRYPSGLPAPYHGPGAGRQMILHAYHSGVDWFAYAVWQDGVLLRSLSIDPAEVFEDAGAPLPFEAPFWAGGRPASPRPGEPVRYQLPFHPFDLADAALQALVGFTLQGPPTEADIEPEAVPLIGFAVPPAHPVTQADLDEFTRTHRRTRYRLGPGGTLIPVAG